MEHVRYMDRPVAVVAERVLTRTFGSPVKLGVEEPLKAGIDPKSNVRRCRVDAGPPLCPASVVVKRIGGPGSYDPTDVRPTGGEYGLPTMAWRLLAEWVGVRFLGDLTAELSPAPRCWGGDLADGIIVVEDLGPGETLPDLLHGHDRQRAERALLAYASLLGRLHALTVGREASYRSLWAKLGSGAAVGAPRMLEAEGLQEDLRQFRRLGDYLGLSVPPGLDDEGNAVLTTLADPGPFLALGHLEYHAINTHVAGDVVRLLDFEYSRYFPCLMDGMFPHLFTWTRHRLPDDLVRRMETIYRQDLARGCPEAGDDSRFGMAYTAARAALMVRTVALHLSRGALEADAECEPSTARIAGEDPGEPAPTNRQRILLLLECFAAEAGARGHLPALGDVAQEAAARLRTRWQAEPYTQPLYPAFR